MSDKVFLYDEKENVLRQKSIQNPPSNYHYPDGGWQQEWDAYHKHISGPSSYAPVSGWVPEAGKEYYEGKDFELSFGTEIAVPIAVSIEQKQEVVVTGRVGYGKTFTIEDMMKAYDAGIGDVNGTEKEKYFKSI